MEYEKIIKEALSGNEDLHPEVSAWLKAKFPELAESEDEKIRKWLVDYISGLEEWQGEYMHINIKDVLAYLEKQKDEAKKQYDLGVQAGREEVLYEIEKQKEQKSSSGDSEKPNNHAGWSEEDKTNGWTGVDLERYLSCLQRLGTGNPQQPGTINSKWFKKHCHPQPKQEWSDEDREKIDALIDIANHRGRAGLSNDAWDRIRDWLFTLPYRVILDDIYSVREPHWKPSEEQMKWLESAVKLSTDKPRIHGTIISLYEQLKRL